MTTLCSSKTYILDILKSLNLVFKDNYNAQLRLAVFFFLVEATALVCLTLTGGWNLDEVMVFYTHPLFT